MVLSSFLSTTRNACVCIFMTRVYTGLCLDGHIHMQNGTYTKWLTTEAIPKIIERFEPFAYCLQRHTPWPSDLHRHTHTHMTAQTHTHTHMSCNSCHSMVRLQASGMGLFYIRVNMKALGWCSSCSGTSLWMLPNVAVVSGWRNKFSVSVSACEWAQLCSPAK
jgi:hypothetical protein